MSSTVVRKKGSLTIPAEVRRATHLEEGDPVSIEIVEEGILLRPQKVIDATQAWFWTATWQAGEQEASRDLEEGRSERFDSGDGFLSALSERAR